MHAPYLVARYNTQHRSADDVYAWYYLVNPTDIAYAVCYGVTAMHTVDEDTGDAAYTGEGNAQWQTLPPHGHLAVGSLLWWELDGACGLDITYRKEGATPVQLHYNLKQNTKEITHPVLGPVGKLHTKK